MKCPRGYEKFNMDEAALANHIAECADCRQQFAEEQLLLAAFASMEELAAPVTINEKFHVLQTATAGKTFDCCATRNKLEEWQAGELPVDQAFLLEEHLLSCTSCEAEVTFADALRETLRSLPLLEAPAAIAEQVAAGRIPWWQRWLLPTPAFSPRMALAGTFVLGLVVMMSTVLYNPQLNNAPQMADMPVITEPVMPVNSSALEISEPAETNIVKPVVKVTPAATAKKTVAVVRNITTRKKNYSHPKKKNNIDTRIVVADKNPNKVATPVNAVINTPRVPEATVVATAREHIENSMRLAALRDGDARGYAASNLTDSGENTTLVCSM